MKFGLVSTAEATGAILAHSIGGLKKGHRLSEADVSALAQAGIADVMVASLEDGDIHEDEAARLIADALAGAQVSTSTAHTGRCNILAAADGLVLLDKTTINRMNRIHESITVATLRPFERVRDRQMVATVKIIPFASPDWAVHSAAEIARAGRMQVAAFSPRTVSLVSTRVPGLKQSVMVKTRDVLDHRLAELGSRIVDEQRVSHDTGAVARAISTARDAMPDIILVMGASATTDRADTIPAAVLEAGGEVEHLGMPVDPGNLLMTGQLDGIPVVGVPGCARSPKLNGLDFVLQRLCAGLAVRPVDIQAMGVGGLLKEIPTRPQQREAHVPVSEAPRVAAVLLAAGRSTRMEGRNKLLLPLGGIPLVAHAARAMTGSRVSETIIVTGHDHEAISGALAGLPVKRVHNPDFATGMASSLKAGLAHVSETADGVIVALGDMPAVTAQDINRMIAAFDADEGRAIIVPVYKGKRGNPVLFARSYFAEMLAATGDTGAKAVINANPDAVFEVEMESAAVLADADTPAAFEALKADFDAHE